MPIDPLPPDALRHRCEPSALPFQTTAEIEPLDGPFEQARAAEALAFGASMRSEGYHVYALGPPGVGKHRLVAQVLAEQAPRAPVPSDWCYVHDFSAPQRPRRLELPAGAGVRLQREMEALVEELRAAVPAAFESEEYRNRLQALHKELEQQREAALTALSEKARARGVALVRTPVGFAVAPMKDGQVVEPQEFHKLAEAEQDRIRVDLEAVQEALAEVVRDFPAQDRKHREQVKAMNREVALGVAGHLVEEVRNRWAELPQVATYLQEVGRDVVENVHEFLAGPESGEDGLAPQIRKLLAEGPALRRYAINVLVDRTGLSGAPVVYEDLPSHAGLVGRIEHRAHFGALWTDFTLVRAGALHRANGGYLVVDVRRLLAQPFAWEDLKRALRSGQIRIDPPERLLGLSGAAALDPEPIPLVVKVVLIGDRLLHLLLSELDPEFSGLFKVIADFEERAPRAEGGELRLARLVTGIAREERLRPFDREAVARIVEQASRLAEDGEKLTTRVRDIADLVRESDHAAAEAQRSVVGVADVQAALDGAERREDRARRLTQEAIAEGTLLVDTTGAQVGQVNGLSIHQLGRFTFGRPSRITARVRLGRGEVVDIEREVELGGPIHSKGVLILAGFLGARFAPDRPHSLRASLVFEQSYGGVEGDSASSAELYALLSALSGLPIRQGIAVTGSVNQHGRVQAIGGVNEKVEGFFDVCRARGLDGSQGVIVPAANRRHLVLRLDVVEAAREGRFHVWAVETTDEGIEILTGVPAGQQLPDGTWPTGSVNALVDARLRALAEASRAFLSREARP
jgi:predicted ATP-dependent protease